MNSNRLICSELPQKLQEEFWELERQNYSKISKLSLRAKSARFSIDDLNVGPVPIQANETEVVTEPILNYLQFYGDSGKWIREETGQF